VVIFGDIFQKIRDLLQNISFPKHIVCKMAKNHYQKITDAKER
jgi:hypothetical protein